MIEPNFMPSNLELEYAILGAVIRDNRLLRHLQFLQPSHFYSAPHAAIYAAMLDLDERGDQITPFTVSVSGEVRASLEDTGGVVRYLAGSITATMNLFDAVKEARLILESAQKRSLIQSCRQVADAASEGEKSAAEHAAALHAEMEAMLKTGRDDFEDDRVVTEQILDALKAVKKPFSTGLSKLDDAMDGGLIPGKSYGFAARKKVGKTILAGTVSCNLSRAGVRHLFICGEMSPQEIHQRTLARLTDTYPSAFRSEYGQSQDFQRKVAMAARESTRCTLYHNAPGLTFSELRRVCASAVYRKGVTGIILDYWQLVGGKRNGQSTSEHLDEVAQWLADFCRKHDVWSITMAQINQEGNTRGGEGMRLAFDQVYALRAMGDAQDVTYPYRWLEMLDTRYTGWCNVGTVNAPGLALMDKGPYFEQADG